MADSTWICSNCRSINAAAARRCYSCRAPREMALDLADERLALSAKRVDSGKEQAAFAERAGEQYRSSSVRAWIVRLAVLAVVLTELIVNARLVHWLEDVRSLEQIATSGGEIADAAIEGTLAEIIPILLLFGALVGVWVVAWICWGAWLSRVVANVPPLGGGWPATSPTSAFWTSVIPFFNIYGATSVLRDVITRLSPKGEARTGRLTAWWLSLFVYLIPWIGLIPGPTFVLRLAYRAIVAWIDTVLTALTGSELDASIIETGLGFGVLLLAAVLALLVVEQVEDLQAQRTSDLSAGPARLAGQAG